MTGGRRSVVVLPGQDCADETGRGVAVGEVSGDVSASADLVVESVVWVFRTRSSAGPLWGQGERKNVGVGSARFSATTGREFTTLSPRVQTRATPRAEASPTAIIKRTTGC